MGYGSGLSAQIGFGAETAYGTRHAPTLFLEFLSESFKANYSRIESKALRSGTRVERSDRWNSGPQDVNGTVQFELQSKGLGLLFKHGLGAIATSQPSAGPDPTVYEHKATLGDPIGLGLTTQVGRPSNDGTVNPFDYKGGKITGLKLAAAVNSIPTLDLNMYAQSEDTAQVLGTASYPASASVLWWNGATVTIAGASYACQSAEVNIAHAFKTDRYNLGALTRSEPIANGLSTIGVTLSSEYLSNVAYARIASGTTAAVVISFAGATISHAYTYAVEVTMPCVRFDSDTPTVNGEDVLDQPITGVALDDGTTDSPIKIVYRTTDVTPA